jgi:thioredoxin-like negative regulator of GroEL
VKVAKVNVSDNMELAGEFNIYSIPRVLIFNKNAKPAHELKGFVPESELVKLLNQTLAG